MSRRGIIGTWQQTKYIGAKDGEGAALRPSTAWFDNETVPTLFEREPESNVNFRVVSKYFKTANQSIEDISGFKYQSGRLVEGVNNRFNMNVFVIGYGLWNILNTVETSDNWDMGITQRNAYTEFNDICNNVYPPISIPDRYENGFEPVTNFRLNAQFPGVNGYWGTLGNQLVWYPDFYGRLQHDIMPIAPMPLFVENNQAQWLEDSGAYGERGVWVFRIYYYF